MPELLHQHEAQEPVCGRYGPFLSESPRGLWEAHNPQHERDEIDKSLGGDSSDGGTSSRVFGKFLTWLNDRPQDQLIFIVASANNISHLPPELLRKGRLDEIFFCDLPNFLERVDILNIHLRKAAIAGGPQAHILGLADVQEVAKASEGYTGAELAEAVIASRLAAFGEGVSVERRHLLKELSETKPLSKTMSENIVAMRSWARDRARMASTPMLSSPKTSTPETEGNFGSLCL